MWKVFLIGLLCSLPAAAQSIALGESLCTADSIAIAPVADNLLEGTHAVTLTWNSDSNTLWYRVYRGNASGGPYVLLADCIAGTSYSDLVAPSQMLFYVVTAVNANGESSYSNQAIAPIPLFDTLIAYGADAISVQIGETLSTSDALAAKSTQIAPLAETLSTSDALSDLNLHSLSLSETLATSDSIVPTAAFKRSLTETLTINDSLGDNYHKTVGMGESLTTLDALNASFLGAVSLAESLSTSDAFAAMTTAHSLSLGENLATLDSFGSTGTFGLDPAENQIGRAHV